MGILACRDVGILRDEIGIFALGLDLRVGNMGILARRGGDFARHAFAMGDMGFLRALGSG
jgi:hypothetical protein